MDGGSLKFERAVQSVTLHCTVQSVTSNAVQGVTSNAVQGVTPCTTNSVASGNIHKL
jgi:hypothetical protein